jgi:hypothetical protein
MSLCAGDRVAVFFDRLAAPECACGNAKVTYWMPFCIECFQRLPLRTRDELERLHDIVDEVFRGANAIGVPLSGGTADNVVPWTRSTAAAMIPG